MKDKRLIYIFGMHSSLLSKVMDSLSQHFENVGGTTSLEEVLALLNSNPPEIVVIGGGVPLAMRSEILKLKTDLRLKTLIAEPHGPNDILDSIRRVEVE
ncbi:MAG: hypothetical protein K2X47_16835 [Bdellovibrionales bacterium]|nr:hypothetical protein [Bdellovibrionales bacterium]